MIRARAQLFHLHQLQRILPLLSNVGVQITGLITGIIVARALSAEGRGYIAFITTLPSVLAYVLDLGIPTAFIRFASTLNKRRVVVFCITTGLAQATLAAVIVVLTASFNSAYKQHLIMVLVYTVVCTPISIITRYLQSFLMGRLNYQASESVRLSVPLSYILFLTVGIYGLSGGVTAAIVANLLANVVALLLAITYFVKSTNTYQYSVVRARTFMLYGARAHLSRLSPFGNLRIELLIIGSKLSLEALGQYVVALALATVVRSVAGILGSMTLAEMTNIDTQTGKRLFFQRRLKSLAILGAAGGVLILLLTPIVLPLLFGPAFKVAVSTAIILTVGSVIFVASQFITEATRAYNDKANLYAAELTCSSSAAIALFLLTKPDIRLVASIVVLSQLVTFMWQVKIAFSSGLLARVERQAAQLAEVR